MWIGHLRVCHIQLLNWPIGPSGYWPMPWLPPIQKSDVPFAITPGDPRRWLRWRWTRVSCFFASVSIWDPAVWSLAQWGGISSYSPVFHGRPAVIWQVLFSPSRGGFLLPAAAGDRGHGGQHHGVRNRPRGLSRHGDGGRSRDVRLVARVKPFSA